uniref:Aubergine n=2 Tax=Tetraselmis sp. GSL018 TaxID=582737 RepID=A0A061SHJ7_9CHLO
MARPRGRGHGREGRRMQLVTNHFQVTAWGPAAVHYYVDIEREEVAEGEGDEGGQARTRDSKPLTAEQCREIFAKLSDNGDTRIPVGAAYDGRKSLFCPGRLAGDLAERLKECFVVVATGRRSMRFRVSVREVAVVDLSALYEALRAERPPPQEALQALDICLRHRAGMIPQVQKVGRSLFLPQAPHVKDLRDDRSPSSAVDICQGYQQALQLREGGLSVSMDLSFSTFIAPVGAVEFMAAKAGVNDGRALTEALHQNPRLRSTLLKEIKGVKFETTHLQSKQFFKARDLTEPASGFMFDHQGESISVEEYFRRKYPASRLKFPDLPCLNGGTPRKPRCFPPEVCRIVPGQRTVRTLKDAQRNLLPKFCTAPPSKSKELIKFSMEQMAALHEDPTPRAFGMRIDTEMMRVEGRVLDPPTLQYCHNEEEREPVIVPITPQNGSWNLRPVRDNESGQELIPGFSEPGKISSWGVVFVCKGPRDRVNDRGVQLYVREQVRMLKACGVAVPVELPRIEIHRGDSSVEAAMQRAAAEAEQAYGAACQLLLVVLPDKGASLYQEVKLAGDHSLGIPTQCVVAGNLNLDELPHKNRGRVVNEQYAANVALKINAKLGGGNWAIQGLPCMDEPCIIFGADISHPAAGRGNREPSIAALVASMDPFASRYTGRISKQAHRVESFQSLRDAVKDLTWQWCYENQMIPVRAIFYRDGVSSGEFAPILTDEWMAIKQAFKEVSQHMPEPVNPSLTYIIVQKRHGTRFFPADDRDGDRNGNVLSGTVVDRGVTLSYGFDFFLTSHTALQGTSRPAHYHVLLDESEFSADQIEALTFNLCFLYCRATKAVGLVTPVYYAHLAAFRGRALLNINDSSSEASLASNTEATFHGVHENLERCMFWA